MTEDNWTKKTKYEVETKHMSMLDITAPQQVEVRIRIDGSVLWVNIDGVCRLRICGMQPTDLTINDERDI